MNEETRRDLTEAVRFMLIMALALLLAASIAREINIDRESFQFTALAALCCYVCSRACWTLWRWADAQPPKTPPSDSEGDQ